LVNSVTLAAEKLSQRRVGALIVFTRETGLLEYVESGVKLDALVSEEAILNIFEPNTPLHDGASSSLRTGFWLLPVIFP